MSKKIYLASSWRNKDQQEVVAMLRAMGHEVYDFKNPTDGNKGFAWSDIDPGWQNWSPSEFRASLKHKIAQAGFRLDWSAMLWAEVCVLLMPCGRSAHIEAGYFVGANKKLIVLLSDQAEPELMYNMANAVCINVFELEAELKKS